MIVVKRFPGVVYRHKTQFGATLMFVLTLIYMLYRWGLLCTNRTINKKIDELCNLHRTGEALGNLCRPLCLQGHIHSISCISRHSKKEVVFTAKWNQRLIVIKSATTSSAKTEKTERPLIWKEVTTDKKNYESQFIEEKLEKFVRDLVTEKLNMTLTSGQLDTLRYLDVKNKFLYSDSLKERTTEIKNIFQLLQSQEYVLSRLFSDSDVFPQVVGTCGNFYGFEYLESLKFDSIFTLDDKAEWSERMKMAIAIMDFVEEIETNFPDALHLCDIQMAHLGVTKSGRIKFLDLDLVYMKNIVDKNLRSGRYCKENKDCDLFDCKSLCNARKKVCDSGVVNDNLQAICEKIFIGWTMSGKIIIPGLLMSEHTPASLSALLRLCAENGREPVPEDLRQRLYMALTEMHQILMQKLTAK